LREAWCPEIPTIQIFGFLDLRKTKLPSLMSVCKGFNRFGKRPRSPCSKTREAREGNLFGGEEEGDEKVLAHFAEDRRIQQLDRTCLGDENLFFLKERSLKGLEKQSRQRKQPWWT